MGIDVFRKFQLKVMGFIAILLPPIAIALVMLVHGYTAPMSISETATIADRTDFLLPLCLGALALFSLSYSLKYSYGVVIDEVLTACMFGGFVLVAAQKCNSPYVTADKIGLFGVSQQVSHIIHCIGAIIGFGAMIVWIMFCFTKTNQPKDKMTKTKKRKNTVFFWLGIGMIASLSIFIINLTGFFGSEFPVVFVVEWLMLTLGGIACLIKGRLLTKHKEKRSDKNE